MEKIQRINVSKKIPTFTFYFQQKQKTLHPFPFLPTLQSHLARRKNERNQNPRRENLEIKHIRSRKIPARNPFAPRQ